MAGTKSEADHEALRIRWRSRERGILTQINDLWLKAAPKENKRDVGQRVNEIRADVEAKLDEALRRAKVSKLPGVEVPGSMIEPLESVFELARLQQERLDIALPGIRRPLGAEHPVVKTTNEIISIFAKMGYSVETGPEIETDYYNFESMNFPPNHPARDTQDTMFIAGQESKPQRDRLLLRTHTSPVQTRSMEKMKPPLRVVIPG